MRRTEPRDQHDHVFPPVFGFSPLEITLTACGGALLLGFSFLTRDILTPPVLAGAGVILLWPVRRHRAVQAMLLAGAFLLIIWLVSRLSTVLIPFACICMLAYLFDPVVTHLQHQYRVHRWISSLFVTLLLVSVIALFVLLLAPSLIGQLEALSERMLAGLHDLQAWLITSPLIDELAMAGIDKEEVIGQLTLTAQRVLRTWTSFIPNSMETLLESVGSVFGALTFVVLMPVLLFYTLKDYATIKSGVKSLFPSVRGEQEYLSYIGHIVGQYLRGQLTISAITALVVSIALMLGDIPFALLIGVLAGMMNLIPNLGAIITHVIGIGIALIFGERGIVDVVIVVGVLLGQSLLEQAVLIPRILSQHVGLHPVAILLSLFCFGYFFGFLGLFIAVPITALVIAAYKIVREKNAFDLSAFFEPSEPTSRAQPHPAKNFGPESGVTLPPDSERIQHTVAIAVPADAGGE